MFNTALTMICNPSAPALASGLPIAEIKTIVREETKSELRENTLSPGVSEDILFWIDGDCDQLGALRERVLGAIEKAPVDICLQQTEHRAKRLLIADMDSTIIEQECIDELAEYADKRAEISEITERAMRGELDFEGALRARVAMLKGLPASTLEETWERRISLTPGARTLVQTMNASGAVTALVSGGFSFFTEKVAAAVGFQSHQANELVIKNGVLTGEVRTPILGRQAKLDALHALSEEHSIPLEETLAVGDGANDLAMLNAAGLGVAFRAKPAVAEAADVQVNYGDLTALLYLQGVHGDNFVTDQGRSDSQNNSSPRRT